MWPAGPPVSTSFLVIPQVLKVRGWEFPPIHTHTNQDKHLFWGALLVETLVFASTRQGPFPCALWHQAFIPDCGRAGRSVGIGGGATSAGNKPVNSHKEKSQMLKALAEQGFEGSCDVFGLMGYITQVQTSRSQWPPTAPTTVTWKQPRSTARVEIKPASHQGCRVEEIIFKRTSISHCGHTKVNSKKPYMNEVLAIQLAISSCWLCCLLTSYNCQCVDGMKQVCVQTWVQFGQFCFQWLVQIVLRTVCYDE